MEILFNNNITRISVREKSRSYCTFKLGIGKKRIGTLFGIFPKYEKVYGVFGWYSNDFLYTIEDFNQSKKYYVEDDRVYYRPHCIIYMNDGHDETIFFSEIPELKNYIEKIKDKSDHIVIS